MSYSDHMPTTLGLDVLPHYNDNDDYAIYLNPEIYQYNHEITFDPDYHTGRTSLGYLDPPQTVAPPAIVGTSYINSPNSIEPSDSPLLPPQSSPLLMPSPISDAPDRHAFSAPSSVRTNKSATLPQEDAYVPSEPESDDDSEYSPISSRSAPRRGQGSRRSTTGGRKDRSNKPNPKPTRKAPYQKSKKARQSPPSRVYQSSGETAALIQAALTDNTAAEDLRWICPEEACDYKMGNKARMPDFRRHLRAHLRDQNRAAGTGHFCNGLLMDDFNQLSELQQKAIRKHSGGIFSINNEKRIGGCQQSFSRGDALTRHVKSKANPCVGWVSGHLEPRHLLDF